MYSIINRVRPAGLVADSTECLSQNGFAQNGGWCRFGFYSGSCLIPSSFIGDDKDQTGRPDALGGSKKWSGPKVNGVVWNRGDVRSCCNLGRILQDGSKNQFW